MLNYQRVAFVESDQTWPCHVDFSRLGESSIPVVECIFINLRCPNMEYPNISQYWDLSWDYDQNQDYEICIQYIEIYMVFCG
jgi:hypothetical protein